MTTRTRTGTVVDWTAVLARWAVGAAFIYMGLNKALHPADFLKLVRQYGLFENYLVLNTIAATLPWFEILCGVLLVLGVAVRGAAALIVAMLIPFTVVVIRRALDISDAQSLAFCAVKFDCGCGNGEVYICRKILENTLMTLASALLVAGFGQRLSLLFGLRSAAPPPPAAPAT